MRNQKGFTLVELLLSMTLFVTVMIISTVGFIAMNRTFTRGNVRKQLSEAVQLTTEDVTRVVRQIPQSDGDSVKVCVAIPGDPVAAGCPSDGANAICITGSRYFWKNDPDSDGLWKDGSECDTATTPTTQNALQLMDDRYKVVRLSITPAGSAQDHLLRVQGTFRTADRSAFNNPDSPLDVKCKGSIESSAARTCAVEQFDFIINARGQVS